MGEALVNAVGDGAVVVERREHFLHAREHGVDADDVENRFLLTGERGVREVFGRGRGTNGDRDFGLAVLEPIVEFADFAFELGGERRGFNPAADFGTRGRKGLHVFDIEICKTFVDAFLKPAFANEEAECLSRGSKTVGNSDAGGRELAQEFAERRILAADAVHIGHAKLAERKDVTTLYHFLPQ